MFWIVAPIVAVGVVAAIMSSASEGERVARRNWESKREEVKKTVEEHRRNIETHLRKAQQSYDFHFLTDLHFSSHRVADSAYKLLNDARESFGATIRILNQAFTKKNELKSKLETSDREQKKEYLTEIRSLNDFIGKVLEDKKTMESQRDGLLAEVKRLNAQTAELKAAIRDRCGEKGRDWHQRLEQRAQANRLRRAK
jgi:chromosome segregation ATPase